MDTVIHKDYRKGTVMLSKLVLFSQKRINVHSTIISLTGIFLSENIPLKFFSLS